MLKKIGLFIVLCFALFGGVLLVSKQSRAPGDLLGTALFQNISRELPKEQNLPGPLQKLEQAATGRPAPQQLDAGSIISLTNKERSKLGRGILKQNKLLSKAAEAKIDDMFAKQYFEHISPSGKGPADVVTAAGYSYILVGENLAEGDFRTNAELLTGWMNSPGHRANIINPRYTEIGAAARKGTYQGQVVWMAVQEFGRPSSDCPKVDEALKDKIAQNESQIKAWQAELASANAHMTELRAAGNTAEYNAAVGPYNALVNQTNALITQSKAIVTLYNAQVQSYNECIK